MNLFLISLSHHPHSQAHPKNHPETPWDLWNTRWKCFTKKQDQLTQELQVEEEHTRSHHAIPHNFQQIKGTTSPFTLPPCRALPGVRFRTSGLEKCEGWCSTSSNIGRAPLTRDSCGARAQPWEPTTLYSRCSGSLRGNNNLLTLHYSWKNISQIFDSHHQQHFMSYALLGSLINQMRWCYREHGLWAAVWKQDNNLYSCVPFLVI